MDNKFQSLEEKYIEAMEYLNSGNINIISARKALGIFQDLANSNHADSQFQLGCLYGGLNIYMNQFIFINYKKSFEMFEKSVNEGIELAKFHLANCYKYGLGIEKNENEANRLYEEYSKIGINIQDKNT